VKGFGGQRPIFPLLAVLIWADDGGFHINDFDSPWYPTVAAAIDAAVTSPKTNSAALRKRTAVIRKKRRTPSARRSTPTGGAPHEYSKPKRNYARRKRG
jgi:hypothetical protein